MMTPIEREAAKKFKKKHKHYQTEIIYIIRTSPLGDSIHAQCLACLKTKDLTDYGCW